MVKITFESASILAGILDGVYEYNPNPVVKSLINEIESEINRIISESELHDG